MHIFSPDSQFRSAEGQEKEREVGKRGLMELDPEGLMDTASSSLTLPTLDIEGPVPLG